MKIIFTIILFISIVGYAANDNFPMGARSVGMGNASVVNEDAWAIFNNISGVAKLKAVNPSFTFERRYNFRAFDLIGAAVNLPFANTPLKYGNVAVGFYRLGNLDYNETRANIGYAHNIMAVSLGIQVEYVQVSISDLGSKGNVIVNFGGQAQITKTLKFGAFIYNINQAKIASYRDERIPTIMKAGLSYNPMQKLFLNVEMEKDVELSPRFKAGVEYAIIDKLFLRTGFNVNPQSIFLV